MRLRRAPSCASFTCPVTRTTRSTQPVAYPPFILAGNGGGLKTGRHLKFAIGSGQRTSNDLLVSILNLFGDARTSYGEPGFNHGALSLA